MAAAAATPSASNPLEAAQAAVRGALEDLTCSICISAATDPVALACGHVGCSECLNEWLSRKSECPLCKAAQPAGHAPVKVHALDNVLSKLLSADEQLERHRLDAALTATRSGPTPTEHAGSDDAIASLFRDHVRVALDTCTEFAAQMRRERDAAVADAERERDAAVAGFAALTNPADVASRSAQARAICDAAVSRAKERYASSYAALKADIEAYLRVAAAPVSLLPATVHVQVPVIQAAESAPAAIRIDVRLRPMDSIAADVVAHVRRSALETLKCDELVFGSDVEWTWEAPMSRVAAEARRVNPSEPVFRQFPDSRPPAGTTLKCTGTVTASSSRASKCLADTWSAGQKEDFSWCTTCGLKWVCATCAETCHKAAGHHVVPFLRGHAPTFACCYCRTRGKCCIPRAGAATATAAAVPTATPA